MNKGLFLLHTTVLQPFNLCHLVQRLAAVVHLLYHLVSSADASKNNPVLLHHNSTISSFHQTVLRIYVRFDFVTLFITIHALVHFSVCRCQTVIHLFHCHILLSVILPPRLNKKLIRR